MKVLYAIQRLYCREFHDIVAVYADKNEAIQHLAMLNTRWQAIRKELDASHDSSIEIERGTVVRRYEHADRLNPYDPHLEACYGASSQLDYRLIELPLFPTVGDFYVAGQEVFWNGD